MSEPFPHIRWTDTILHGRVPRHSAGYLAETLAGQTVWGGGTPEETADWYQVDVEVVRECVRWVRCYLTRRGSYERAFSGGRS